MDNFTLPDNESLDYAESQWSASSTLSTSMNITDMTLMNLKSCSNCTSSVRSSPGASIAVPIATSVAGIIGNAIALYTIRNTRKEHHRTVFFVLVGGLAWADLIGIILTTPPVLLCYSYGKWIGGENLCNYHAFTMIAFGMITPLIVCAMAVERYIGIRHGYFYTRHFNTSMARHVLLSLWLITACFSALPLFGFGTYALQYPKTWCFLNIHPNGPLDTAYALTFAGINFLLIGIIIFCNIVVQCTLIVMRWQRNRMMRSPSELRQIRSHRSRSQQELEIQMVILLLAITIVFTACWAPLMVEITWSQFHPHITAEDHKAELFAVRLASINQVLDPWVYILCRKMFFTRVWNCCRSVFMGRASQKRPSTVTRRPGTNNMGAFSPVGPIRRDTRSGPNAHGDNQVKRALKIYPENNPLELMGAEKDGQEGVEVNNDNPGINTGKECSDVEVSFRDSGTDSIEDKGRASGHGSPHLSTQEAMEAQCENAEGNEAVRSSSEVPIPVFSTSKYCIRKGYIKRVKDKTDEEINSPTEERSDLSISESIQANHQCHSEAEDEGFHYGDSPKNGPCPRKRNVPQVRRHSWSCLEDNAVYKYLRTKGTQTFLSDQQGPGV